MKIVRARRASGRRRLGSARRARPRARGGFGDAGASAASVDAATTSGRRSSTGCSPSSTWTRSAPLASSSTPPTGWPARCSRPSSSGSRRSTSSAATSSRTARSRTTSRTRCSPRTASSSSRKTLEEGADLGVAFDGDADRCFFVDDTGEFVPGDFVTALLAEACSRRSPAAKVIYDVRASWAVPETIEAAGGVALVNRVGHAFIKHRMREEDAVFGGEVSAHYYFRDFSQADSGVVPFLLMLELISQRGRKLSELLAPFRARYFLTGEINTPVADVAAEAAGDRGALRRRGRRSRISTASRSTSTTGTSTCARRTPSRCCG